MSGDRPDRGEGGEAVARVVYTTENGSICCDVVKAVGLAFPKPVKQEKRRSTGRMKQRRRSTVNALTSAKEAGGLVTGGRDGLAVDREVGGARDADTDHRHSALMGQRGTCAPGETPTRRDGRCTGSATRVASGATTEREREREAGGVVSGQGDAATPSAIPSYSDDWAAVNSLVKRSLTKPKRYLDAEYIAWVRTQPCLVHGSRCQQQPERDAHHLTTRGAGGSDRSAVPLCREMHQRLHALGWEQFRDLSGLDLWRECWRLNERYEGRKP